ncbi:hypothetical protein [Streptomyces sp. NPDC096132]|uniref:hypothetical protein n=1 Tax=Streptomyces sp. NPDC096132 TaxID=3366075 RepID=UPI0038054B47
MPRPTSLDLLPERDATALAPWLRAHFAIEAICRDRYGAYAAAHRSCLGGLPPASPEPEPEWETHIEAT